MAKLSGKQCHSMVYHYFLFEGWLPAGIGFTLALQ